MGISIVVAITIFNELNNESNKDAIRQEMLIGASNAQAYFYKSISFGGGNGSFLNISQTDLGIDTSNFNGVYFMLDKHDDFFNLTAITRDNADTISARIDKNGLSWN